MLPPRLIVVLLVDRARRVVKTERFGERTYIGDPFNIIRLFNEKEVDEICVLDIDASKDGREPEFAFAADLAAECFMPMSFGGGIANVAHARRLIGSGIEKLVLQTHASDRLIGEIGHEFGAQALVGCVDYIEQANERVHRASGMPIEREVLRLERAGVGEIILQSISRDGSRQGMDIGGVAAESARLSLPLIALGGAATVAHLNEAVGAGADAAASGSAFCFIGPRRAVLVTYPDYTQRVSVSP